MSNCPFCNMEGPQDAESPKKTSGLPGRAWRSVQWLAPASALVIMPKCPMCVVAYIALFTGLGISVSTARWIQLLLLAICVGTLAYLVVRRMIFARRDSVAHEIV